MLKRGNEAAEQICFSAQQRYEQNDEDPEKPAICTHAKDGAAAGTLKLAPDGFFPPDSFCGGNKPEKPDWRLMASWTLHGIWPNYREVLSSARFRSIPSFNIPKFTMQTCARWHAAPCVSRKAFRGLGSSCVCIRPWTRHPLLDTLSAGGRCSSRTWSWTGRCCC